jgi:hypothetical protein
LEEKYREFQSVGLPCRKFAEKHKLLTAFGRTLLYAFLGLRGIMFQIKEGISSCLSLGKLVFFLLIAYYIHCCKFLRGNSNLPRMHFPMSL